MPKLLDVSHVSKKGVSMRMTLPKIIRERLELKEEDIVGFYEEDGKVFLKKIA
jgi:AbrB family looped-hinge helix DNA binding protein